MKMFTERRLKGSFVWVSDDIGMIVKVFVYDANRPAKVEFVRHGIDLDKLNRANQIIINSFPESA